MADATGEARQPPLRVAFDRRLKLEFHGARITSDGGLLAYRELDDALDLTAMGVSALGEGRRGKNIRHRLLGMVRQAVYGRLAGYEDVNDAARLAHDPANFLRTLVLPEEVAQWSLTTLREKLVKIGARIVRHGRYVVFRLAEVAVPRALFAQILRRIDRLRPRPPPLPA